MKPASGRFAPRIYYFHPLLAGTFTSWPQHLSRCRDMGFDHVLLAPIFAPGAGGDIFLSADHDRVNPAIEPSLAADAVVEEFARACRAQELRLLLDVVIGEVARDAALTQSSASWFVPTSLTSTHIDPRQTRLSAHAAYPRFDEAVVASEIANWWIERLTRLAGGGCGGLSLPRTSARAAGRLAANHLGCPRALSGLPVSGLDAGTGLAGSRKFAGGRICGGVFVAGLVGPASRLVC